MCPRQRTAEFSTGSKVIKWKRPVFFLFMELKKQLTIATKNFGWEQNLSSLLIPTMSKHKNEQLKLAHKVIDIVDQAEIKICVTLLRYSLEKPESSFAQVQFSALKKVDEKFQQIIFVHYQLEEFISLLDVMKSVHEKFFTKKLICNVLYKRFATSY